MGKRQPFKPRSLADDDDLAGPPVHVVEREPCDLPGTQPQPREQRNDREISPAHGGVAVKALEQQLNLAGVEPPRQQPAARRHRGHRRNERARGITPQVQEREQRPQRTDQVRGRLHAPAARPIQHERGDLGRRQAREIIAQRLRALREEHTRGVHV
jgi:hypothetical protein